MRVGTIELKVQKSVQYTGRKARVGKICFSDEGKLVVQAGYCDGCRGKVNMTLADARKFASLYAEESHKVSTRVLSRLVKSRQQ